MIKAPRMCTLSHFLKANFLFNMFDVILRMQNMVDFFSNI